METYIRNEIKKVTTNFYLTFFMKFWVYLTIQTISIAILSLYLTICFLIILSLNLTIQFFPL